MNGHGEAHDGIGWGGDQIGRSVLDIDHTPNWHDARAQWGDPGNVNCSTMSSAVVFTL